MPKATPKHKQPITHPRRPNRPTPQPSDNPEIDLPSLPQRIKQATELISKSNKIAVLIGAGVSTSSGIPDFRSPDGLYAAFQAGTFRWPGRPLDPLMISDSPSVVPTSSSSSSRPRRAAATIGESSRRASTTLTGSAGEDREGGFDLIDPQELMNVHVFRTNPEVFYSVAWQLLPGLKEASETHRWIKTLEDRGKLLRVYTQNVDQLELAANINAVTFCHGSFATASCLRCHRSFPGSDFHDEIKERRVPMCPVCKDSKTGKSKSQRPFVKPDITFFGETVDRKVGEQIQRDKLEADLLVVIGTSLLVPPVNLIPAELGHVPQILINRDAVKVMNPTVFLQGHCDDIVRMFNNHSNANLKIAQNPFVDGHGTGKRVNPSWHLNC